MTVTVTPPIVDSELIGKFGHISTWVFDLDNTLYPADSGVWLAIEQRITLFLIALSGLDGLSARALQKYYYLHHGTTLRGLVDEQLAKAEDFLEFVHDIDRSGLAPNLPLAREIGRLPGRKLIFTNGSRNHALRTAEALGLADVFEDVFDIMAAELVPKPSGLAYDAFFRKYGVDPTSAAMFEDIAKNLLVPKDRGMTTTLVVPKLGQLDYREPHDRLGFEAPHIDFVTDDLAGFLARINGQLGAID